MMAGAPMMLELYADNLDTPLAVSFLPCNYMAQNSRVFTKAYVCSQELHITRMHTLDKAVGRYSWTVLDVAAVIQRYWPAHMIQTRQRTITEKMLE